MGKRAIEGDDIPVMGVYTPAFRLSDGDLVVCSGIVPVDEHKQTVGVADAGAQTRQVLLNLQKVLRAAGATLADVVHLRVFSVDMNNRQAINDVRREFFEEPMPASTHLQIVRLVEADWLLEVEATAFIAN